MTTVVWSSEVRHNRTVRRVAVLLTAIGVAVVATAAGTAGVSRDAAIKPGKGIGKVELGMTLPQVRRAFGRPPLYAIRTISFGARGRYVEYGWEVGTVEIRTWKVGFRSTRRKGTFRVVRVATTVPGQRTPEGLGVGSRSRDIFRSFPDASCEHRGHGESWIGTWVVVQQPGGGMTAFDVDVEGTPGVNLTATVIQVLVQRSWLTNSGASGECPGEYRTA